MTVEVVRDVFLWCSIINGGLFILIFLTFSLAHNWIYRIHSVLFNIPEGRYDTIMYSMIIFYKTCWIMFNIIPYIALRIAG